MSGENTPAKGPVQCEASRQVVNVNGLCTKQVVIAVSAKLHPFPDWPWPALGILHVVGEDA